MLEQLKPKPETIHFLLNFSKSLATVKVHGKAVAVSKN